MNKKKIFARIGSVLACVLLVGALAVPCFADDITATVDVTVPYGSALEWFNDLLDDRANNTAYQRLQTYYNGFGDGSFFQCATLVSGFTDIRNNAYYSVTVPLGISTSNNNQSSATLTSQIELEAFAFSIFTTLGTSSTYTDFFANGYITVTLYYENNNSMVDLAFYATNEQVPRLSARYNGSSGAAGLEYQLTNFSANGVTYTASQLAKVETSFTLLNSTTPYMLSLLTALLYNRDIATYNDVVYSPANFYYGINSAYGLGYADGERYGYANGFEDGKVEGYELGLEHGRQQAVESQEAYDKGFADALNQVSAGEFGRNFLAGVFTAPLDALQEFNLVEWETQDGRTISINLITILSGVVGLSLFIWFLKMFAGG